MQKNYFVTKQQPNTYDSNFTDLHYIIGENINYLYPLYQLLGERNKFIKDFSLPVYYDLLSQSVSFVGDYSAALEYQKMSDTSHLTDVEYRQIGKSNLPNSDHWSIDRRSRAPSAN